MQLKVWYQDDGTEIREEVAFVKTQIMWFGIIVVRGFDSWLPHS